MATIRFEREGGKATDEIAWHAQDLTIAEKPNGPAAAALISAGISVLVLAILTVLAEANADFKTDVLDIKTRVGPLSGKTTYAVAAYLVSWVVLAAALWRRNVALNTVFIVTGVLIAGAFVGTYPKFFLLFEE